MKIFKNVFILIFLGIIFITPLEANNNLAELISEADIIVEGNVVGIFDDYLKKTPGQVGQSEESIVFKFSPKTMVSVDIQHIFKGHPSSKTIILVSTRNDVQDLKSLSLRKSYILFLKKHKKKGLYYMLNEGQSQWRVFDYDGKEKVKAWHQTNELKASSAYQNYSNFVNELTAEIKNAEIKKK
jgi:hypothetical protein